MRFLLSVAILLLGAQAAMATCELPPAQPSPDGINYIMGIEPSDGILDVWCRFQALRGDYKITVLFPGRDGAEIGAKKSLDVSFDGTFSQDRIEFATFIQSLLPMTDRSAMDEFGKDFGLVLEDAVQGLAVKTPGGEPLGIPPAYDFADELILWQPIAIRIEPLNMAGVDFTLSIRFEPNVGRYLMQVNGQAEDLILRGWHANVLRRAGPARDSCPPTIPQCADFGDVIDVRTAWVVNNVVLEAKGSGLSAAAMTVLGQIVADNSENVHGNPLRNFSPTKGQASFDITGTAREILLRADGDRTGATGTKAIRVMWHERFDSQFSYAYALADYGRRAREAMVMANPVQD